MLRDLGWQLNDKQVARLWRREGLKVPMKQPKRSRLWLNDRSCIPLRPQHVDHVWSSDFVHHRTEDGRRNLSRKQVRQWIKAVGAVAAYIEPGPPRENGHCESFNAHFRDELLIGFFIP